MALSELYDANDEIVYYTDGSALGTTEHGGFAFCTIVNDEPVLYCEIGVNPISNNRMEMMGMLRAIQHACSTFDDTTNVVIYSDSNYVIRSLTPQGSDRYNPGAAEYRRKKNLDLWKVLVAQPFKGRIMWIKAHNGTPGNELADQLANKAAQQSAALSMQNTS